ncbi:MAG: hypothetical protein KDA78_05660 [Planctomycetaceae bacterium]|nr:hypothetical protein [Planctomycetaceae bacterium]
MSYERLILHFGHDPDEFLGVISDRAVKGCWFELLRQGGCGAGELRLSDEFGDREVIQPGHWIGFEGTAGDRWYTGRVEQVENESPSGVRVQLEGAVVELNGIFPGALSVQQDGVKPHRYGLSDRFSNDPDYDRESHDYTVNTVELVRKLIEQYVVPRTNIQYVPAMIETDGLSGVVVSAKFRGEESVRSILKDIAMRAGNAVWGVDEERRFFFRPSREATVASYGAGRDVTRLTSRRTLDKVYNRVTLTGDYVYDVRDYSSQLARRSYRWRGHYRQPGSISSYGERRLRLWIPWIRTAEDARSFVTEFFRVYAEVSTEYRIETCAQDVLPRPWDGQIELLDRDESVLACQSPERVRVQFDYASRYEFRMGPEDPREVWAEPPHDERFELPEGETGLGNSVVTFIDSGISLSDSDPDPSGSDSGMSSSGGSSVSSGSSADSGSSAGSDSLSSLSSGYGSSVSSSFAGSSSGGTSEMLSSNEVSSSGGSDGITSSAAGSSTGLSSGVNSSSGKSSDGGSSQGSEGSSGMSSGVNSSGGSSGGNTGSSGAGSSELWNSSLSSGIYPTSVSGGGSSHWASSEVLSSVSETMSEPASELLSLNSETGSIP